MPKIHLRKVITYVGSFIALCIFLYQVNTLLDINQAPEKGIIIVLLHV